MGGGAGKDTNGSLKKYLCDQKRQISKMLNVSEICTSRTLRKGRGTQRGGDGKQRQNTLPADK